MDRMGAESKDRVGDVWVLMMELHRVSSLKIRWIKYWLGGYMFVYYEKIIEEGEREGVSK